MSAISRAENATKPSKSLWESLKERIGEWRTRGKHGEKMVGWYDPGQLFQTGIEVAISTIFGQHADRRTVEALAIRDIDIYDYTGVFKVDSKPPDNEETKIKEVSKMDPDRQRRWEGKAQPKELWFDYVSDVGDGWNPTYANAYYLAQASLDVKLLEAEMATYATQRGHILIMGGDEVYPTATVKEYHRRLIKPYEAALPRGTTGENRPDVYAIPGNHDWYDSLSAFTKVFWEKEDFADWEAPQSRSYFALELPHQWWLLGIDVQLGSDLDGMQLEYFRQVAAKMKPGDRIILCCAEPFWVFTELYKDFREDHAEYFETNLLRLENEVLKGHKIACYLAGDLHHYYRVQLKDGTQKITSGGGGAFLHPTHGPFDKAFVGEHEKSYPPAEESAKLGLRNLLFPVWNWKFGILTAIVYWLACWSLLPFLVLPKEGVTSYWEAFLITGQVALASPIAALWTFLIVGGFLLFTDTHSKVYRIVAGITHGIAHTLAVFLIGWGSYFITVGEWGMKFQSAKQWWAAAPMIWLGGYLIGPMIMGLYLFISLNLFTRHYNEAFSSLAIQDWKNFLRMKIDAAGNLTIYPIGMRKVPRRWRAADAKDRSFSKLVPDVPPDSMDTVPHLIERPIVLTPTADGVRISKLKSENYAKHTT